MTAKNVAHPSLSFSFMTIDPLQPSDFNDYGCVGLTSGFHPSSSAVPLPASAFLEVEYENIVNDMEGQARRLIEWVGLEWNDACLGFHKTKRTVRTASLTQVRQPIYGSSVERWRNYEQYLGPLLEQLSA